MKKNSPLYNALNQWMGQACPWSHLTHVENIIRSTKDNMEAQNYYGVALVMKSWIMSYVTDAYGDVPYSEATKGISDGNVTPAFDP
ncbi:SusD/RagB family nutrient-binding outer membrane lipoprotein, partial [Leifsonia sp. SIMBA_070]|uniref:SusD/RagB family nutrient-binding outer membrane lipoprotein n=1 Tax=Leifsonia sp. SIMBA_070 TaxID=3085810 RepID=UPI00397C90E0